MKQNQTDWSVKGNMMNNDELNDKLYSKMIGEMNEYREWLLSQPPKEILKHAYEYSVREDILMSLQWVQLEDAQALALLKLEKPLQQIYDRWNNMETSYMEMIGTTVEAEAKYAEIRQLARQVLYFVQKFDATRMGYGKDDEQAVENIAQQLCQRTQRNEICVLLQSFLDHSDPEEEVAVDISHLLEKLQDEPKKSKEESYSHEKMMNDDELTM